MPDEPDDPFDGHTHYFYDSQGHLYADLTAMRERGRLEVVPLEGGEVSLPIAEIRVGKQQPVINLTLTASADANLESYYRQALDGD